MSPRAVNSSHQTRVAAGRRPVIGISTGRLDDPYPPPAYPVCYAGTDYVEAVVAAGGVPLLIPLREPEGAKGGPSWTGESSGTAALDPVIAAQLAVVDGLVITGGPDLVPLAYGEEPHPALGPTLPVRDRFDAALLAAAEGSGLPVLAICRGIQVINVAHGGTLYQDLPSQGPADNAVQHTQYAPRQEPTHSVHIEPESLLAAAVRGRLDLAVTSFHHQAVKEVGEGLAVTARAADGVIEAIEMAANESTTRPWLVGVQWHPEMSHVGDEASLDLFRALVEQASRRSDRA